jgi:hypothetical protein
VTYFRFAYTSKIDVALACSKTRVAPTKTQSIPRVELKTTLLDGFYGGSSMDTV